MDLSTIDIQYYLQLVIDIAVQWIPPIVKAILMLWIGFKIIAWINKLVVKGLETAQLDATISKFLSSVVGVLLKVFLLISVAGIFGIETTSFIALIGAAGLAIGMSLQGSLSNFAGGIMILMFKPYEVGDLVEFQGVKGHVEQIGVFTTTVITPDKNTAIIPNGPIINNNIMNLSVNPISRVDVHVGIGYNEDIDTAREVLLKMMEDNAYIIDNSTNAVLVHELGDSSVNLIVRAYVKDTQYFDALFELTEQTKKALDAANIDIPFPQRVIHTA